MWQWSFDPGIDSDNSPCLIFNNVNGYIIEESDEDQYFIIAFINQNKKVLKKYTKLWTEIKNQIETIYDVKSIIYEKDFTKIRFESDDDLPLGIILNIPSLIIVTRFVFQKDSKCYPQALQKCYKRVTKMLQYGKIDASAGIDVDKTDASKECMLCHYWCFKEICL